MARKKPKQRLRSEGDRYPSGQLKSKHVAKNLGPNEEMQRMRNRLFAGNVIPYLAVDFPLDVLFARSLITEEQRRAGYTYQQLRWRLFGRPVTRATGYSGTISGDGPSMALPEDEQIERDKKSRKAYEDATVLLLSKGRAMFTAVENAAIYLRIPRAILFPLSTRQSDAREIEDIKHGLGLLAAWYGYSARQAA